MNSISNSLLQPVFAGLDAATSEIQQSQKGENLALADTLQSYDWSASSFPPVGTAPTPLEVAFDAQIDSPDTYFARDFKLSGLADSNDILTALQNPNLKVGDGIHDLANAIRNKFESSENDLESQNKIDNFQIQEVMSQFQQAQDLMSQVQQKQDETDSGTIGKIG